MLIFDSGIRKRKRSYSTFDNVFIAKQCGMTWIEKSYTSFPLKMNERMESNIKWITIPEILWKYETLTECRTGKPNIQCETSETLIYSIVLLTHFSFAYYYYSIRAIFEYLNWRQNNRFHVRAGSLFCFIIIFHFFFFVFCIYGLLSSRLLNLICIIPFFRVHAGAINKFHVLPFLLQNEFHVGPHYIE